MERLIERCCGLDVLKKTVTACVRVPGANGAREHHVRTFGTTVADLLGLRNWLEAFQVTRVAMESTGVYWKPVFYILEETATCVLANATKIGQVPGRKTDVKDCVWIAQLLEHGLIRESFVPPAPIRELRDLTRYRKAVIQERTREANRVHKVLEDAGIKLASVASLVLGVSGPVDARRLGGRHHGSGGLGRPRTGQAAQEAARLAAGAGRTLPWAPRLSGRADPGPPRLPRRGDRDGEHPDRHGDRPLCRPTGSPRHHPRREPAHRGGPHRRARRRHACVPYGGASRQRGRPVPRQ